MEYNEGRLELMTVPPAARPAGSAISSAARIRSTCWRSPVVGTARASSSPAATASSAGAGCSHPPTRAGAGGEDGGAGGIASA